MHRQNEKGKKFNLPVYAHNNLKSIQRVPGASSSGTSTIDPSNFEGSLEDWLSNDIFDGAEDLRYECSMFSHKCANGVHTIGMAEAADILRNHKAVVSHCCCCTLLK